MDARRDADGGQEPIAVIGMSCRLPDADSPEGYWQLLRDGRDAVGEAPEDRWPRGTAAEYRRGGFVAQVDGFDAGFFGITGYEAGAMDPQQRMMLELAWHALEHAQLPPGSLRGSATGVFVGAIAADYALVQDRAGAAAVTSYTLTGQQRGIIANRVSYHLGLVGPSVAVDTGQSSSLVAVQHACESLRRGDSKLALAGGINLNLLPETTDTIGRFGALSPDGRCYTFDSRANGYVRGEGGGLVVLKPLSAARADGDRVYAVILGGAVNNDGGGGDSLTTPSRVAQAEVIRAAHRQAGIAADGIQYVELHGTGTPVGDPVEAAALGDAVGHGRTGADAVLVGSVKSNIGHLEGGAGIAGLLKVVLSITHRQVPASLNFAEPHPEIPLRELGLDLVTATRDWPAPDRQLLAGVSSFGMGGTNCHLVVGEPPTAVPESAPSATVEALAATAGSASTETDKSPATAAPATAAPAAGAAPWVLSAQSGSALRAQAAALAAHLEDRPGTRPVDVARSLLQTRDLLAYRAVLVGADPGADLDALAQGRPGAGVVAGTAVGGPVTFVFPGQGSQWPEMARELLAGSPVFATALTDCAAALAPHLDYDLLDVLRGLPDAPDLDRASVVQPALWAVMVALAELWRSHGVEPDAVIGHSQGEIAAATVAGALSLADAARVVALRSRAAERIAGRGSMMSVAATVDEIEAVLAAPAPDVVVAAVNGPRSAVLSGPAESLAAVAPVFEAAGQRARLVPVDYPSHSAAVDELRSEIVEALAPVSARTGRVPLVSTVTGAEIDTATMDAEYWFRGLRQPVRFADAVRTALDSAGGGIFVECSPHPVLLNSVEETIEQAGQAATASVVGTLRRGEGGAQRIRTALGEAFAAGAPVRWDVADGRRVALPGYAFQRQRYWLTDHGGAQPGQADEVWRRDDLLALVTRLAGEVLGRPAPVDPASTFKNLGLDSVGAVELRHRLGAATGLRLPSTIVYNHPSAEQLARHLHELLSGAEPPRPAPAAPTMPAGDDAIAIVAIGCRYPGGVASPEDLWQAVVTGADLTGDFPTDRGWNLATLFGSEGSGTSYVRRGGFLRGADQFDAGFFGISPREALAMDPQQRILLETAWETIERAGIDAATLRGSATGVFVGMMASDYGPRLDQPVNGTDGHLLTGSQISVASGRIAYTFGFTGPAMTVDTACSSSLVAIHLAVGALRRGECTAALAGGATVMSRPGTFVEFSRQHGLAADGRCKSFSAEADGTAFAEGVGLLLLERLSDAQRLGHPVLAVIRGTAVNQDGASNGLTAPNGTAQQAVIRQALTNSHLTPADIDAVEAHGTGTRLGDPIEAQALITTYGHHHTPDNPLWLGSMKSNIGHTQAAAGVAGVIKMVMAMRNGLLPATLHAAEPSPEVDWVDGGVQVLSAARDWPEAGRPRRAGVSSFGISGTNAHVIVEAVPTRAVPPADEHTPASRPTAWVLTAQSDAALRGQAGRLHDRVAADEDLPIADVAHTLATGRGRFDRRAVLLGHDRTELLAGLAALRDGDPSPALVTGRADGGAGTAFVFTGQGGQRPGMGRELYDAFDVFARALDEVCAAVDRHLDRPLREVMFTDPDGVLNETRYTQPALFAYQVAAYRLLESFGVRPDRVAGHSVGEIAAAYVAGVWSLADAARLVVVRGSLMQRLPVRGAMVAIAASADEVRPTLAGHADVGLAAVNGPGSVVVSGDEDACQRIAEHWQAAGRRVRRLTVSHAFHSPLMEPMRAGFAAELAGVTFAEPTLDHVTDLAGLGVRTGWSEPAYWVEQIRQPVMFQAVVAELHRRGTDAFVEVGPQPVLSAMVRDSLPDEGSGVVVTALHRKGRPEPLAVAGCLAELFAAGNAVDWTPLTAGGRTVDLPTYAFDRRRSWLSMDVSADLTSAGLRNASHPMLRMTVDVGGDGVVATGRLSVGSLPWLGEHRMAGALIVPGTAILDLVLEVAAQAGCDSVEELTFETGMVLPAEGDLLVQLVIGAGEPRTVRVYSRTDGVAEWTRHASGTVTSTAQPAGELGWATAWPPPDATAEPFDDEAYERLADRGYEYGDSFRAVRGVWRRGDEIFAEITGERGLDVAGYGLHPALLDAALHPFVLAGDSDELRLPFQFRNVRLFATAATTLRVRLAATAPDTLTLLAADNAGAPVLAAEALALRAVPANFRPNVATGDADGLYTIDWEDVSVPSEGALPSVVVTDGSFADVTGQPDAIVLPVPSDADPEAACAEVLAAIQRWLADERLAESRLVVVTERAVVTAPGDVLAGPGVGAVWGLVRVAQSEFPDRVVLVDVDTPTNSLDDSLDLIAGIIHTGTPQAATRGRQVRIPRLTRANPGLTPPNHTAWALHSAGGGTFDSLTLTPQDTDTRPLRPGELRIAVRAAGVNFRDVVVALGMVPGLEGLGGEGAGTIIETGPDVTGHTTGDRVFGLLPNAFGPTTIVDARLVAPIPPDWTYAQAAAVPIAFLTAYYGLITLANLQPGQRVLIHAATGGVGMAAVQLARNIGAEILTTASPTKWPTLQQQGIPDTHIANSRNLDFEHKYADGVNVVLNSLAGEYIDASLRLLHPDGHFIEMGKTDIRPVETINTTHPHIHYQAFDLPEAGPDHINTMLTHILHMFTNNKLHHLPKTCYDIRQADTALRYLSQARHTGKIILTIPTPPNPHHTTLITGGTGTLAQHVARHLVHHHGHRNLILTTRRDTNPPEITQLINELQQHGATITTTNCDMTNPDQIHQLITSIKNLDTVIHTAGILDDGILTHQNPQRLHTTWAPKAHAAWTLHHTTTTHHPNLTHFILFSSIAATLGNPGQANYAAANAYLDTLATWRQHQGLPATSIAWGLWNTQSTMTTDLTTTHHNRLNRTGITPITPTTALALLTTALTTHHPNPTATQWDLSGLRARVNAGEDVPPLLRGLVRAPRRTAAVSSTPAADAAGLRERIGVMAPEAARQALADLVATQVASALALSSASEVKPNRTFREAGFDSLTSVELRNRLSGALGTKLAATVVFDHPTPRQLAEHLHELLAATATSAPTAAIAAVPAAAGQAEPADDDPIALVAMACRYPGAVASPEDLWELVAAGTDAVSDFPTDRGWDLDALFRGAGAGTSTTRQGGFVAGVDRFDPGFFGISPREALAMDPQQRILLETAWETIERAGIDAATLRGSATGVFVGMIASDYGPRLDQPASDTDGHLLTGSQASVASGRIAYTFGFTGPAMTVDTACSSSLVAIHLAVGALRRGECTAALAGGATVMPRPSAFVQFSMQHGLAADGRCKAFSSAADGTGWGEGAGLLLLERLSDAQRLGHPVLAVIRGTAVNQDGASNGLTAPNGTAQQAVIRQALTNSHLTPADIDAVEAHGTGTRLGDPIEAQALITTYGHHHTPDNPLWLGSVKSNIGHTQAAAGVAGVIKMVMAMRNGLLPPTLHVNEPSPHVDWTGSGVRPLTEPQPWPESGRPRRAGVSSFGMSGTNVHLVLEQYDTTAPTEPESEDDGYAWVVSARTRSALADLAGQLGEHLAAHPGDSLAGTARGLAARSRFEHRAVVVGAGHDDLVRGLAAISAGDDAAEVVSGVSRRDRERPVLVFPGQGAQWAGMGAALLDTAPVFRDAIAACETALAPYVDWSLTEVLRAGPDDGRLERLDVVQPASFAMMVALARLWESVGVTPAAVIGHSQGEIAAAHIAGALTLDQAAAVTALRSQALTALSGRGGMVSVPLPEERVRQLLADWPDRLGVAAVNGPASVVVSGDATAVDEFLAACAARDVDARRIPVDYASHSHHVEEVEQRLREALGSVAPTAGTVAIISTVTGEPVDESTMDAGYWYANLRQQVRFDAAVRAALDAGHDAFIEVSAHPVLAMGLTQTIADAGADATVCGTLRRDQGDRARLLRSWAEAFTSGVPVDWTAVYPGAPATLPQLPGYPFQRDRYWLTSPADAGDPGGHGLLGTAMPVADTDRWLLTGRLSRHTHPWLADHAVRGSVLLPGTAFVELAVHAVDRVGAGGIEELTLHAPLLLPTSGTVLLQLWVDEPDEQGRRPVTISGGLGADPQHWVRYADGLLGAAEVAVPATGGIGAAWPPAGARPVPLDGAYDDLAQAGYEYGPAFRGLRGVWQEGEDLYVEAVLPEPAEPERFELHPALLDAALHGLLASGWFAGPPRDAADRIVLPYAWSGVRLHAGQASVLRMRMRRTGPEQVALLAVDTAGAPVLEVAALSLREAADIGTAGTGIAATPDQLYQVEWVPAPVGPGPFTGTWWVPAELTGEVPGAVGYASWAELRAAEPDGTAVVVCPSIIDASEAETQTADLLELMQHWLAGPDTRIVVATLGMSAVWGLVRVAQSEFPDRVVLVDVDTPTNSLDDSLDLIAGIIHTGTPQAATRGRQVRIPRLTRANPGLTPPNHTAWALHSAGGGTFDSLTLTPQDTDTRPLRPGELRIAVRAAGVNFRDVVVALGMVPGLEGLGGEGAGTIIETGPDVTGHTTGDRVFGLLPNAFGPTTIVDARLVAPIPPDWTYAQAAAVPIAFLTAYYGLITLANLQPGQRVLIHAATGGVGMAAVQLARNIGAEILTTASPTKWPTLQQQGIPDTHIANSRNLDFEHKYADGVNVVLNSLAGEYIDASLRLLHPDGHFIEMGKTDIRPVETINTTHPHIHYQAFDLPEAGPDHINTMLTHILHMFTNNKLHHLPKTCYDIRQADTALRYLSQARHTGKIILTIPTPPNPHHTTLITGGTGTLAQHVARHLVHHHGHRNLILTTRRDTNPPEITQLINELQQHGATITTTNCDMTNPDQIHQLITSIKNLDTVIHTAGILDDGILTHQNPQRLHTTWAPKAHAAWTLHHTTTTHHPNLTHFILFSSIAATLGNPGQANYAAANAYLDTLATWRQHQGLPATSIAWGLWNTQSTMTTDLTTTHHNRLNRTGITPITPTTALALLTTALTTHHPNPTATQWDLSDPASLPPMLSGLVPGVRRRAQAQTRYDDPGLPDRLASLSGTERQRMLEDLVRQQASIVLAQNSVDGVDPEQAFRDLGFDSLTSVELRNRLSGLTGLRLAATVVFDHPTPRQLAEHLRDALAPPDEDPLTEVERLLAARADAPGLADLLRRYLDRLGPGWSATESLDTATASDEELFAVIDGDPQKG
ncbi:SDR family NAD(P)-dependent oxidoreductase [Micromonospora sp. WMMD1102]|uniref:type I polyketide synthase n=1 Tax=Micromonospora sp. WMMD1102 TaxID=3016105 RepID=UPI002414E378|nr:type I polyketide synthase [Micromonospora sp. WMMD1102]MDG4785103.1 SDR family NAD(P)-dependent oxidoreductase [Micromonospora sp. WMMD1102]